jgi:uncharacterized protein
MTTARRSFLKSLGALPMVALGTSALAGCASANPNYYRLGMIPGPQVTGGPAIVEVRSVSIPGYLDRDSIIKSADDYKLNIHNNDLWAEPLADMLQAAMVQDLSQRLPGTTVLAAGGSISATPDALVEINVLTFDPDASGTIIMSLQVSIKSGQNFNTLGTQPIRHTMSSGGTVVAAIVGDMSTLWGQAADDIAPLLVGSWHRRSRADLSAG